jgi:hypothetical protein
MLGIPEPRRQSPESNVLSGHLAGIGDGDRHRDVRVGDRQDRRAIVIDAALDAARPVWSAGVGALTDP